MDSTWADTIVEAVDAGYSFGYAGKEGAMGVRLVDGVYEYYLAGDDGKERKTFDDRGALAEFLRGQGEYHYRDGVERYLFSEARLAIGRGALHEAEALLTRGLEFELPLSEAGLMLLAIARDDEAKASAALGRLDAWDATDARRRRPVGALEEYFDRALTGVYDKKRYRALDEGWSAVLRIAPGRAEALAGRGFARKQLRRWADAATDLQEALATLDGDRARELTWFRLVECIERQDEAVALEVCEEALRELPDDRALTRKRASLEKRLAK